MAIGSHSFPVARSLARALVVCIVLVTICSGGLVAGMLLLPVKEGPGQKTGRWAVVALGAAGLLFAWTYLPLLIRKYRHLTLDVDDQGVRVPVHGGGGRIATIAWTDVARARMSSLFGHTRQLDELVMNEAVDAWVLSLHPRDGGRAVVIRGVSVSDHARLLKLLQDACAAHAIRIES